ncbi:hypothetical protein pCS0031 (plasmid) [Clavibacter sepedonicus]|uniref:Uncharacterized protein n=1 Tax=Clavibacter sepedonicus TaxID=31964 RepID=B0RJ25_CLASE|nr:hypothetical protein pCS0031 [Clavibacter sepedonicus]
MRAADPKSSCHLSKVSPKALPLLCDACVLVITT